MPLNEMPELLSVKDVQKFLNISRNTAYKIFKQEDFPSLKLVSQREKRVLKSDFLAWLENQKKGEKASAAARG